MGNAVEVRYRLPRSVVRVTGTVTIETSDSGEPVVKRATDVSLGTEAEPSNARYLEVPEEWGTDREFDVKLTDDERLSSAEGSSKGVGAKVIEAGIRAATMAVKLAPAIAALLEQAPDNVPTASAVQEALEAERKDLADRQAAARARVEQVSAALGATIDALAGDAPPADGPARLEALTAALEAARKEAAALDAEVAKWRAERFPAWTQTLAYTIGTGDLPQRDKVEDRLVLTDEERTGEVAEVAAKLGVVVVRVKDALTNVVKGDEHERKDVVFYRRPRRVQLAIYEEEPSAAAAVGAPSSYRLRRVTSAWVVDRHSPMVQLAFRSGLFAEHGATFAFGDAGTLTHVTNKSTSAVGTVAGLVSGAGAQIQESLEQAEKISGAFPGDPARAALQNQVDEQELQARLVKAQRTIAGQDKAG